MPSSVRRVEWGLQAVDKGPDREGFSPGPPTTSRSQERSSHHDNPARTTNTRVKKRECQPERSIRIVAPPLAQQTIQTRVEGPAVRSPRMRHDGKSPGLQAGESVVPKTVAFRPGSRFSVAFQDSRPMSLCSPYVFGQPSFSRIDNTKSTLDCGAPEATCSLTDVTGDGLESL